MNRVIRNVPAIAYLLGLLALPSGVIAQTPTAADSPTPLGGIVALGIIIAFLLVAGISVKLYDITRKREEGLALHDNIARTWPSARVEDRIVVEPHRMRHTAA